MAKCISRDLKLNVLKSLLGYPQSASYKYTDIDSIFTGIQRFSESMACPVLFVGSQLLKSTLQRSYYDPTIADRHGISRQDGFDKRYICHVDRCEVYSLMFSDVDYCILTTKELFDTVSFRKISDGQYVDVDFELNTDSDTIGKLIFKYWMKVDLAEGTRCIKLELVIEEEDLV